MSSEHRLPRTVIPSRYELILEPNIATSSFDGSEVISITVGEPVTDITLNAIELDIEHAYLTDADGNRVETSVDYDTPNERITLTSPSAIEPGEWNLHLAFKGTLNDQLRGFYRSTFTDDSGTEQVIATTQFEAADARRAFPCWDEPDFKAQFAVTLIVPENLTALSNMSESGRTAGADGKTAVTFAVSPIMSTYLVAFVVGPLEISETVDVDGVPLRVVFPPGKGHLTSFALDFGAYALRWLTDYYGIPYPGDKVDFIAIPDFAFGAMENLGAITYRERLVLIDMDTAGQFELRRIADVIAHELAHMWFGDLVTMKWWNGIWLNEAFASFMEMKAVESYRPNWKRWLAFAVDPGANRSESMDTDALASTRAVEFEVHSPEEANEMFDSLTYGKGAAILRMIEQYLGTEIFRDGVRNYLVEHSFGNTETEDLWRGLDSASDGGVGDIMDTWILQSGYPEVAVERAEGGLRISQQPFRYLEDPAATGEWQIPMVIRYGSGEQTSTIRHLLTDRVEFVPIDDQFDWVIANGGGHGFYRVRYTTELSTVLRSRIVELEPLERFTFLDDTWAFVIEGSMHIEEFTDLATAFRAETEHGVWQMLSAHLLELSRFVPDDPRFAAFVRDLLGPTADRLGWNPVEGEIDLTRRLRSQILSTHGRLGSDASTIEEAKRRFPAVLGDPATCDAEVALAVLSVAATHGDQADYEALLAAYKATDNPQYQARYLGAFTYFPGLSEADRTFEMALDGSIRGQDAAAAIGGLLANQSTSEHIWNRVTREWKTLTDRLPPATQQYLVRSLPAMVQPELARSVEAFFSETAFPVAAKALAQNLELQKAMVELGHRESSNIEKFLSA